MRTYIKKIKELDIYISDGNYSSKYPKASDFVKEGIPFIRANNIVNGNVSDNDMYFITIEKHNELQKGHVKTGDVLITNRGNIGQVAIVPEEHNDSNLNAQIVLLRPNTTILNNNYLKWVLQSNYCKQQYLILQTGTALKQLPIGKINELKIIIHELNIQKNISDQLDKINGIIMLKQKQIAEYDQLIKSRFVEMFGDPIKNDKRWKTDKLNTVCPVNKYKGQVESNEGKVWLLNLDMIESNTGKIIKYVFENESDIANSTIKFNDNCVLYSKLRPYLNKVVVPLKSGYATSEIISMQTEKISKYFLFNLLRMKSFVDFANGTAYGAKMPRASVDRIKNFDLILPPIDLQNKFEKFVLHVDKLKFD